MDTLPLSLHSCVLEDVFLGEEIGRGAHGRVWAATWEETPVAVKHFLFDDVASDYEYEKLVGKFMRLCERSSQIRHPNIVRFLGIFLTEGAPIPRLVMERLSSNLDQLLIKHPVIPDGIKYHIVHGVSLGIRFLHTRRPSPIIHRDLSSKNVLVSSAMEGKIGDLRTAQFADESRQSPMTRAPGAADFMAPEVLTNHPSYSISVDLFSFGCVMLHMLSHEWPTPKLAVIADPNTRVLIARSELERREIYMQKLINRPGSIPDKVKDLITQCLSNYTEDRPDILTVTDCLADIKSQYSSSLSQTVLDAQVQLEKTWKSYYNKINSLFYSPKTPNRPINFPDETPKIQTVNTHLLQGTQSRLGRHKKNNNTFWNSLKMTRQQCPDLLVKCWPTSVTELDGRVYIIAEDSTEATYPCVYDVIEGKWFQLPALPYHKCSLVSVPDKKQLLAIGGCKRIEDAVKVTGEVFVWNEDEKKWLTEYPIMPTARFSSSSIYHKSMVIIAGGVTCYNPWIMTSTVEILSIEKEFSQDRTHWSKVERLPYVVYDAVPLIVQNNLYIAGGFDKHNHGTCKIVTASLSELQKSGDKNTSVWERLPDMPYSSFSINHYQGHLITFTGVSLGEQPAQDKPMHQFHLYNPDTKSWDYVATASEGYIWGRSVHIKEDVLFVVGGTTGTIYRGESNLVRTCLILLFVRKGRNILHNAF